MPRTVEEMAVTLCENAFPETGIGTQVSDMSRDQICEIIKVTFLRGLKKVHGSQTICAHLTEPFSEYVKDLYELYELFKELDPKRSAMVDVDECKKLVKALFGLRAKVSEGRFIKICEKLLEETEHLENMYIPAELIHIYHLCFVPPKERVTNRMAIIEEMVAIRMAIIEEMANILNDIYFTFICQASLFLIMLFRRCILPNCKKKTRLKTEHEKASLLILWSCGDVERNPGPAISDITRDFCKKMISMLVIKYWEKKEGRKLFQADYKKKPDGWPDDFWYGDPSTCKNDTRNIMLKLIQKICIDNDVELPSKWVFLLSTYHNMQERQCSRLKKSEYASELHSWLYHLRSVETTDQIFDRLPEIDEQERYSVLEHVFERLKQYLPDLSSQCLQSRITGQYLRKMETRITISQESDKKPRITDEASIAMNSKPLDLPLGDSLLDQNRHPAAMFDETVPETEIQMAANENKDITVDNYMFDTALSGNFATFVDFLGDCSARFEAYKTTVTSFTCTDENTRENDAIYENKIVKRRRETAEVNDLDLTATKRYKTSDSDCGVLIPNANASDVFDFDEIFSGNHEGDIYSNTAETTLTDLMTIIEPEILELNSIPNDNSIQVGNDTDLVRDELLRYLSEELIKEYAMSS